MEPKPKLTTAEREEAVQYAEGRKAFDRGRAEQHARANPSVIHVEAWADKVEGIIFAGTHTPEEMWTRLQDTKTYPVVGELTADLARRKAEKQAAEEIPF